MIAFADILGVQFSLKVRPSMVDRAPLTRKQLCDTCYCLFGDEFAFAIMSIVNSSIRALLTSRMAFQ